MIGEAVAKGELMMEAMMLPSPIVVGVPVLTISDPPVDPPLLMEAKTLGEGAVGGLGAAVFPPPPLLAPPPPVLPLLPLLPF